MRRAHNLLNKEFPQEGLENKLEDFFYYYYPLTHSYQLFFEKVMNGTTSLSDAQNPKWNSLNDMQIISAACHLTYQERETDTRIIIVTNDKGVHKSCKKTYLENNIWNLQEYLDFLG